MKNIIIVGAGASGLMAAITAAGLGASVTVLEQNEKPGKKINATGNGRCNLTNLQMPEDAYRGTHPEFVNSALASFSVSDTIRFFSEIGAAPVSRNGYIYPRCNQAGAVTDLLLYKASSLGVKIKTRELVSEIKKGEEHPWTVTTQSWQYPCDRVIFANGSKASAIPGSDGSGYQLAESLGHHIIPPFPALCALRLEGKKKLFSQWAGIRTEGTVTLQAEGSSTIYRQSGELQLTDYGISGIPVFQISRYAVQALNEKKQVSLSIDFLPDVEKEELGAFLEERIRNAPYLAGKQSSGGPNRKNGELLYGLFPEKLAKLLCACTSTQRSAGPWTDLISSIKELTFSVKSGMDFSRAQVCGGGVDTTEIDAGTMESRLQKGIYFTGELLDVDGTCGGYNLQWAWSSGYTAGKHAALKS